MGMALHYAFSAGRTDLLIQNYSEHMTRNGYSVMDHLRADFQTATTGRGLASFGFEDFYVRLRFSALICGGNRPTHPISTLTQSRLIIMKSLSLP